MSRLKWLGAGAIYIFLTVAFFFVVTGLLRGTAFLSALALPFLLNLANVTAVVVLPLLVLLAFARPIREIVARGFLVASYIFGIALWAWAFVYTLATWGWWAVVIGLLLMGVGVLPIAMFATLLHGEWGLLGQVVLGVALTFGSRAISIALAAAAAKAASPMKAGDAI